MQVKTKNVRFRSKDNEIVGDLFIPENSRGGVLIIHGASKDGRNYGARKNNIGRALAISKTGFTSLIFDLSGYGESDGDLDKISISDHLDDAITAFDYLKKEVGNSIHVLGGSYGGYLATLLTELKSIKTLVLRAPAMYEDSLFNKPGKSYKIDSMKFREEGDFSGTKIAKVLNRYNNPLYIIGSELDECVPKRVLEFYFEKANSKNKRIDWIKGATHSPKEEELQQEYIKLLISRYSSLAQRIK